jgi:alkanesulfonate monooxygenase SsuD/methylene tetrahydromethanopterin reductase-like flavin-dependent oxidoreductase (luciferase family)
MYLMRFDMRAPDSGASTTALYAAALDMVAFAETRGALMAVVCEHHGMEDGYLPSPMVLATAMAARTTTLPIMTAVILLPLYDPIRLAEDMAVLDIVSGGRVSHVAAIGYRPEEYEQHGVDFHRRGKIADAHLEVLLKAKTGERFSLTQADGARRTIHVTPPPVTPGGPRIAWGGGSPAAARRAGRFGLDFFAQGGGPELEVVYAEAAREAGHEPGFCMVPPTDIATTMFVVPTEADLDAAWDEVGPYVMHDVLAYASINEGNTHTASISTAKTAEELRAQNRSHRIITVDEAVAFIQSGQPLQLQPLVGGLPPEIAWRYLRTVTDLVMPRL